jgi:hypothetical protein
MIPINEEGLADMHAVKGVIASYYRVMYFNLFFGFWSLLIIGLLVFAMSRIRNSN